jgi:Fic family protein
MDHVGVMALDPAFVWLDRVILDLHFDACYFQKDKDPGLWRTGQIAVTGGDGRLVYEGPVAEDVRPLMAEVVDWLANGDLDTHVVVRAAMAHLHTVSVHPFCDGNGRISRIVQSLVLARERLLSPEFASIEEYLGAHTPEYYAVLQRVQGGRYQPERDATEWIAFCIEAHLAQARQRLEQTKEAGARWTFLEDLVASRGWPDRLVIALEQSLIGGTDRASYSREADISTATASNDFRRLVDAGLVAPLGRARNTRYHASPDLGSEVAAATAPADTVTE